MKELLLQEKWRPKSIKDSVILDRIKNIVESNPKNNFLFFGNYGTGKTTLARILIGEYTKKNPFLKINTSLMSSIETLRTTIDDFCSKVYMGLELDDLDPNAIKYVLLDEFERASAQFQDALKVYIEEYSTKNVRFILITNHLSKVSPGIRSRMIEVDFDCKNHEEEKELKIKIYKRIKETILPKEGLDIPKEDLISIIKNEFPDFRSIIMSVDVFIKSGGIDQSSYILTDRLKNETFNLLLEELDFDKFYHFVVDNYGPDGVDSLINLFGSDFIKWVHNNLPNKKNKIFEVFHLVSHYNTIIDNQYDPIVCGVSFLGKVKEVMV